MKAGTKIVMYRNIRALKILFGASVLLLSWAGSVSAQVPTAPPADVQKVLNHIADLDLLKALNPLKLTDTQRERFASTLKEIFAPGPQRLETDYKAWRALAADLEKAREEALSGAPVPVELENRVIQTSGAADDRFTKNRQQSVRTLQAVADEILTQNQKDEIERQVGKMLGGKRMVPPAYRSNPSKAPKEEVQALAVGLFLDRILLSERAMNLLKLMKSPEKAAPEGGNAETTTAP